MKVVKLYVVKEDGEEVVVCFDRAGFKTVKDMGWEHEKDSELCDAFGYEDCYWVERDKLPRKIKPLFADSGITVKVVKKDNVSTGKTEESEDDVGGTDYSKSTGDNKVLLSVNEDVADSDKRKICIRVTQYKSYRPTVEKREFYRDDKKNEGNWAMGRAKGFTKEDFELLLKNKDKILSNL